MTTHTITLSSPEPRVNVDQAPTVVNVVPVDTLISYGKVFPLPASSLRPLEAVLPISELLAVTTFARRLWGSDVAPLQEAYSLAVGKAIKDNLAAPTESFVLAVGKAIKDNLAAPTESFVYVANLVFREVLAAATESTAVYGSKSAAELEGLAAVEEVFQLLRKSYAAEDYFAEDYTAEQIVTI
jgi:hypothetical protein